MGRTHLTAYYKNKGAACFDFVYYLEHSPDLRSMEKDKRALWDHFVNLGLFEDRNFRCVVPCSARYGVSLLVYRFTCTVDYMLAGEHMPDRGLHVRLDGGVA